METQEEHENTQAHAERETGFGGIHVNTMNRLVLFSQKLQICVDVGCYTIKNLEEV